MKKLFQFACLLLVMLFITVSCGSTYQCAGVTPEYKKFIKEPLARTAYTNIEWKRMQ